MASFAIVPAAGRSQRMGQPKLLLPWDDATVIDAVLAAWRASGVTATVVVTHSEDLALAERCRAAGAVVVLPPVAPAEMKDSIRLALQEVERRWRPTEADAWLLAPADMPLLSPATIDRLLTEHRPQRPQILIATQAGRRGHPVLFPWPLAAEVQNLTADEGVNALVHCHGWRGVECPPEERIFADLDTPDDYRRLRPPG